MDLLILIVINGERVNACTRPLRYESIVTITRSKIALSVIGILCTVFFFLLTPLAPVGFIDFSVHNIVYDNRLAYCVYDLPNMVHSYIYAIYFAFAVILPIAIILLMVIKLLHVAKRQAKRIARELKTASGRISGKDLRFFPTYNKRGIASIIKTLRKRRNKISATIWHIKCHHVYPRLVKTLSETPSGSVLVCPALRWIIWGRYPRVFQTMSRLIYDRHVDT